MVSSKVTHRVFSIIVLLFFIVCSLTVTFAHELCADFSGPKPFPNNDLLSYCTEYNAAPNNGKACCTATDEAYYKNTVEGLKITKPLSDCPDMLRKLLCTNCDPWEAHLLEAEFDPNATRSFAVVCQDWCGYLYHACSDAFMYWNNTPSGVNLFGGSSSYLRDDWPTVELFCAKFGSPPSAASPTENCFRGSPYTPSPPRPIPDDAPPVCIEWFTSASWSPVPTSIQDPHDGTDRLFIVYQDGNIHVHRRSTGEFIGTFLTVPNVLQDGEAGLTALAFHPNYSTNGRFFIHYSCILGAPGCEITCIDGKWCGTGFADACINGTCKADHISVIAEYRVSTTNPNFAEPIESRRIMTLVQPFRIHNLGALLFGPDGYMYIGFGDGGNFNDPLGRGQSLTTLLGKVLRIDVDSDPDPYLNYRIPRDNPFYGVSNDDVWNEIWAIGFRNPWSCSFDPERPNKGLFCADVGQDLVEEINLVKPGRNYGWRMWEGNVSTSINPNNITQGFESAIVMYTRQFIGTNNAVISGHVYRGSRYPPLRGTYLAADHVGILWAMPEVPYDSGKFQIQQLRPICANDSLKCTTTLGNIFTVGVDSRGDIYYVASRGVYRLVEMDRCKSAITTTTTTTPPPSFSTTASLPVTLSPQDTPQVAPTTTVVLPATPAPPPTNIQTKEATFHSSSASILICGAALHVILFCIVAREGLSLFFLLWSTFD